MAKKLLGIVLLTATFTNVAEELNVGSGWYLSGNVGFSDTRITAKELEDRLVATGTDARSIKVDKSDTSVSFGVGYQYNQRLGVEVSYLNLGERSMSGDLTVVTDQAYTDVLDVYPQSVDGFSVAATGTHVLNEHWFLRGKAGLYRWSSDFETQFLTGQVGLHSESSTDFWWGGSLEYKLDQQWDIGLSFQRFTASHDKIHFWSLGLTYHFNDKK